MKLNHFLLSIAAAALLTSCGGSKETTNNETKDSAVAVEYVVDSTSVVTWKGNMTGVKAYSHFGTIAVQEGSLTVLDSAITAGTFTINMKSIVPTDSAYSKEKPKEHLVGHLSNGDFFLVDSFPTSTFVITKMEGNTITGNLTVRGKTNEEKVTDVVVTSDSVSVKASGKLVFDRQKYGVAFKVPMKDFILADNIELTIDLAGKKK
ncbi:MAG: YceI family protein [Cytophagaceae bacterium]|jgi:polyisoprenoid-binding protein YceI|nr:YceI family protein [Cytophagaceae bacterium]